MTSCTINADRRPHNAQRSKQRPVVLSEALQQNAKHEARLSNISDQRFFASLRMTAFEKSSCRLVLLLANQGKFFAFYHRAIDRYLGDIFAARHVVHDVEHNAFEQ
jgi:hypothetical protein